MSHTDPLRRETPRQGDASQLAILSHIGDIEMPPDLIGFVIAARREGTPAFYWEKPSDEFAIVGLGSAWHTSATGSGRFHAAAAAVARLREVVTTESSCDWIESPILVGGFSFGDEIAPCEAWRGFEPARITLPEVCIVRRGDRAALIRNVQIRPDTDTEELALDLAKDAMPRWVEGEGETRPQELQHHPAPAPDAWTTSVESTVAAIRRGDFDKLVMARSTRVRGAGAFDLSRVLRMLSADEVGCTVFSMSGGEADFVGATPETLVSLDRGNLQTYALAGTTPRGNNADRDHHLREALASSGKDRSEHDIVVRGIADDLGAMVDSLEVSPQPEVVSLKRVQHLRTSLRGRVAPQCRVLDVVAALHPSPAVGGYPKEVAVHEIARREEFERGCYAAPVGWTTLEGDGEFAVGLRSGVVRSNDAWVFAGAGIVRDSEPRAELMETELKLRPMLAALGHSARRESAHRQSG